jgi:hypothetical protein
MINTNIEVNTKQCYVLEVCKNHVIEMIKLSKQIDQTTYIDGLLDSLYNELDHQHELLKSPQLSKLERGKSEDIGDH